MLNVCRFGTAAEPFKVIIINSEKGVASEELISEVANHIEENRPIGAEVTVESAAPLTINVSAKAHPCKRR